MSRLPSTHACCGGCGAEGITRREALLGAGAIAVTTLLPTALNAQPAAAGPPPPKPLRVQPVLTYELPTRQKATSWRSWGGIQTQQQADAEGQRIEEELRKLAQAAGFPIEVAPIVLMRDASRAANLAKGPHDVLLLYAAGGGGHILEALTVAGKHNLMFLRHDPGPVYLWYEIAHPRFLRKTVDEFGQPGWHTQDVVVDSYPELLVRLRALHGLQNALGKRIVAVGGPSGWGVGGQVAPGVSRDLWKMDIVSLPYPDLGKRIQAARADAALVRRCHEEADKYAAQPGITVKTDRTFIRNAFVLRDVLRQAMADAGTDAVTINSCMGTIMPMSETTACLPLSLLNDEGYLAFCESDFVVIPSGVLLHHISGKPVFLNDPTYPHAGVVTIAHCTAPRKMDGARPERTVLLTHFESDYGAAPKVEMKVGQTVTNLIPDFASKRWVGFAGTVVGNPFLDICRSQTDVRIHGDNARLLEEMGGFHWMTCYGDYMAEVGYALRKAGVGWLNLSA